MAKRPFNAPFEKLKDHPVGKPAPKPTSKAAPPPAPPPPPPPRAKSEVELWEEATSGTRKLDPGAGTAAPPVPPTAPEQARHPDLDAVDELRALVGGDAAFDLTESDEFIEGCVAGFDHKLLLRLRRGEFAVQGHLDLHGLKKDVAKREVEEFIRRSRLAGKRCVLVVHGRGLHSKDQIPVLKDALRGWLATHRFGKHVLAFATAKPADGGPGAIYLLLRRIGRG